MFLAQEWESYATHRKTLRVSFPQGNQRSTYWLQLPYRYGIPLLVASAILHWLVSQSLFLARIISLDEDDREVADSSVSSCGYSNIALVFVIGLGSLLVMSALTFGSRRFCTVMPLARSCSAAISAACHPPETDTDAAFKAVRWGVVEEGYEAKIVEIAGKDVDVRHCCFTSLKVTMPIQDECYA